MKSKRNNIFTKAAPRLLKEYPLAFVAVIFAAIWLYSLCSLCLYAVRSVDGVSTSESVSVGGNDEIASLREGLGLYRQRAYVRGRLLKLAEASEGSPFHVNIKIKPETAKYLPEQAPPALYVRAVAVGAKARTALINLDGEEGILVHEEETLLSGAGKVVRIDSEGVTWTWNSEEFFSSLKE